MATSASMNCQAMESMLEPAQWWHKVAKGLCRGAAYEIFYC